MLLKPFYGANITLISKPDKNITKKEFCTSISWGKWMQTFSIYYLQIEFSNTLKKSCCVVMSVSFQQCKDDSKYTIKKCTAVLKQNTEQKSHDHLNTHNTFSLFIH
jgi:hypothetical protein